jgi:hypothetical protein
MPALCPIAAARRERELDDEADLVHSGLVVRDDVAGGPNAARLALRRMARIHRHQLDRVARREGLLLGGESG